MPPEPDKTRYLTVVGVLHPDNRLELEPGFVTEHPEFSEAGEEESVTAELLDDAGRALVRHRVPASAVCGDTGEVQFRLVAGKVPLDPAATSMRLLSGDIVLAETAFSREPPALALDWRPGRGRGMQKVSWQAEHPEGRPLRFIASFSHDGGAGWSPLGPPFEGSELELDLRRLPGGERCLLRVTATDGFHTVEATTKPFALPERPCQAMILAPEEGTELQAREPVLLQGQGYYLEEARPELESLAWSSSIDGPLGEGTLLHLAGLTEGDHEITLRAGEGERAGQAVTHLRVLPDEA